jgi:hypothetical protein
LLSISFPTGIAGEVLKVGRQAKARFSPIKAQTVTQFSVIDKIL